MISIHNRSLDMNPHRKNPAKTYRPLPWPLRSITSILIGMEFLMPGSPSVWAALESIASPAPTQMGVPYEKKPEPVKVAINRTVPKVFIPSFETRFSDSPSDQEISRSHIFSRPLVPIGTTTVEENRQLAQALLVFNQRATSDDASALTQFLEAYPHSAWKASVLLNLGIFYRHTGWISKALDAWDQTWALAKNQSRTELKDAADLAVAELLELNARLGRYDRLESLFKETEGRAINPALAQQITGARQGLWLMQNRPQDAFRCGPMALAQIGPSSTSPTNFGEIIYTSRSTSKGMSLASVCDLANQLGMEYQMAWRKPGSAVKLPAVVHWKAGHYAALTRQENGKYLVQDPTFGDNTWISPAALDTEASGYCLVGASKLPPGWKAVSLEEGRTVWGKGNPATSDNSRTRCYDKTSCPKQPAKMAQYDFQLMLAGLTIFDTPVGYTPPRGPSAIFGVTYNHRESYPPQAQPPSNFGYANLGPLWTFGWLSYIVDDPNSESTAYCFLQGGGYETYTNYNSSSQSYGLQPDSNTILIRTSSTNYERDFPDGSKQIFGQPDGTNAYPRKIFLTQEIDPAGNAMTLSYTYNTNASGWQMVAAQDALGQVSTVSYGLTNDVFKITQVTDPFGRSASFQYDGSGQLTNITDVLGITSGFTYTTNAFINSFTTPYGTTMFTAGQYNSNTWVQATDPMGQTERVEYTQGTNTVSYSEPGRIIPEKIGVRNAYLNYRDSFYWDKNALALYPGNYSKAELYHWLHTSDINVCSGILESTKKPLENRVWYSYPGQPTDPTTGPSIVGTNSSRSATARVLDDGSTQIYQYQYNGFGKITQVTDPTNRVTLFTYATNMVDLIEAAQLAGTSTQTLAQFTYNTNHLPLTSVDAAGQTTHFAYNVFGQLTAITNALNQVTTMAYDTNGYLTNITGALPGATAGFTYDSYGRVRTATDSEGYTIITDYDVADRPTMITYPDGTTRELVYSRLDPILTKDRRGHWITKSYDPLRRLTDVVDTVGRHTHFEWCGCGSLASITDPLGRVTSWVRDVQSRVITKVYPDNSQIGYTYENSTSRLKMVADAKNQTTAYIYFIDDNLAHVTYSNAVVTTPNVSFTYDTNYNRILSMTDGVGTTTYSYYTVTNGQSGAGKLSSIDGPFSNDTITYSYDALDRVSNRAINGVVQALTFDALGRVTVVTNALGSFTNSYLDTTLLLASLNYPNGQTTTYSYYGTNADLRLQEIWNKNGSGSTVSKFDYTYDPDGQITTWTKQADANSPTALTVGYDPGDQLLSAVLTTNTVNGAVLKQYLYNYDSAGNRLSETIETGTNSAAVSGASFNKLNQFTSLSVTNGPMLLAGNLDKGGSVKVNSIPATMYRQTNFTAYLNATPGTNIVPIIAADTYGNTRTNKYQIVVTNNGVAEMLMYDLNGNLATVATETTTNTYQWDAANRLIQISQVSTNNSQSTSQFAYDGAGRRVQDIELQNGVAVGTNTFLWCNQELCEQRDMIGGTVTRRFFGQGEQISGTNYFFTLDHLGSVREMTDNAGTIRARYDYDPYGRRTKVQGDLDSDFGFTGHYYHATSGLWLALYRAYDSNVGRWLSRDRLAEGGGLNLYEYVESNPLTLIDPFGLEDTKGMTYYYNWVKGKYDLGNGIYNKGSTYYYLINGVYTNGVAFNNNFDTQQIINNNVGDEPSNFVMTVRLDQMSVVWDSGFSTVAATGQLGYQVGTDLSPQLKAMDETYQQGKHWYDSITAAWKFGQELGKQLTSCPSKKPHIEGLKPLDNSHDNGPGSIYPPIPAPRK